MIYDIMYFIFF